MDGGLIREMRLTKQECSHPAANSDLVAPGCEAELLTAPGLQQVFTPFMNLKQNATKIKQLPQESDEYYDDEYNDAKNESIHYVAGDTPTIYAATNKNKTKSPPKVVVNSPSSSGFTFFGVPLPSLNNLLGTGRKNDVQPTAQRKAAIVNLTSRGNGRGKVFPPTVPEIQTGGFVPIIPGSGGFKPMLNITQENNLMKTPPVNDIQNRTYTEKREPLQSTKRQYDVNNTKSETVYEIRASDNVEKTTERPNLSTTTNVTPQIALNETEINKTILEIYNYTNGESFNQTFKETNEDLPYSTTTSYEEGILIDELIEENASSSVRDKEETTNHTPLTSLLVPGGQQPQIKPPAGRSTITKVTSPHAAANKPLSSSLKVTDVGISALLQKDDIITEPPNVFNDDDDVKKANQDTSWYFTNYNRSNIESYVGHGNFVKSSALGNVRLQGQAMLFLCAFVHLFD